MSATWPTRIVVIDPAKTGTAQLLYAGMKEAVEHVDVVAVLNPTITEIIAKPPDLILAVLADNEPTPSIQDTESGFRPNGLIPTLWELVSANKCPVHVMIPSERFTSEVRRFTPLHSASLGLSGIAGIWEVRTRLLADLNEPVLLEKISRLRFYWEVKKVFVYGRVMTDLHNFNLKLSGARWPIPEDDPEQQIEEGQVRQCFMTALALSTLTSEELKLDTDPVSASMEKYAIKLLELRKSLGLEFSPRTLADRLRWLVRTWQENYERFDRKKKHEMPIWARRDGFPEDLPLIRDCPVNQISDTLYTALSAPIFDDDLKENNINIAWVDFHRKPKLW